MTETATLTISTIADAVVLTVTDGTRRTYLELDNGRRWTLPARWP